MSQVEKCDIKGKQVFHFVVKLYIFKGLKIYIYCWEKLNNRFCMMRKNHEASEAREEQTTRITARKSLDDPSAQRDQYISCIYLNQTELLSLYWMSPDAWTSKSSKCVSSAEKRAPNVFPRQREELQMCFLSREKSSKCVSSAEKRAPNVFPQQREELQMCFLSREKSSKCVSWAERTQS